LIAAAEELKRQRRQGDAIAVDLELGRELAHLDTPAVAVSALTRAAIFAGAVCLPERLVC
jgi:hypothetical protein